MKQPEFEMILNTILLLEIKYQMSDGQHHLLPTLRKSNVAQGQKQFLIDDIWHLGFWLGVIQQLRGQNFAIFAPPVWAVL